MNCLSDIIGLPTFFTNTPPILDTWEAESSLEALTWIINAEDTIRTNVNPWLISTGWLIVVVPPNNTTWLLKWYLPQTNTLGLTLIGSIVFSYLFLWWAEICIPEHIAFPERKDWHNGTKHVCAVTIAFDPGRKGETIENSWCKPPSWNIVPLLHRKQQADVYVSAKCPWDMSSWVSNKASQPFSVVNGVEETHELVKENHVHGFVPSVLN